MKKLHPLLSVLFLISTGFGQNEQSMYDNLFFTKSKHWKVKDFYYTSTKENLKKLTNSNDGIFLEDDTLHIIKNYKFSDIHKLLQNNGFRRVYKTKMPLRKSFNYIYENEKLI